MKSFILVSTLTLMFSASFASAQHAGHAGHGGHGGMPKATKAPDWTAYPVLIAGGRYSRSEAKYQSFNMHAMEGVTYASYDGDGHVAPDAAVRNLSIDDNGALSFKIGEDGSYYLVRAVGHGPGGEEAIASTFKYFSKPGPAPRDLLNARRPGFEIIPAILPREHSRYRENQTWAFRVRMNGAPVADTQVVLETSNGTRAEFVTGADGIVDVTFPRDFKDIPKDQWNHGRPLASQFVLAVRHGGLLATFNGDYSLDAYGDKNVWAGVGFAVLGMAVAAPLVRRRKKA